MDFVLHGYSVNEPTWFYLSLLLIIAVYFRFNRIWSLRNLDLLLMLSIAPALLFAEQFPAAGSLSLLIVTGSLLARTLLDGSFTRRPKLPQNMNTAGLAFLGIAAAAFLMTKVMTEAAPWPEVVEAQRALEMVQGETHTPLAAEGPEAGAASRLLFAAAAATPSPETDDSTWLDGAQFVVRLLAILAHLAVIAGLLCMASWHFGDISLGIAMSTLYLLIPCTAYEVGQVNHVLPAALILWACVYYRNVWVSGALMGLACGTLFFPVFLLPVWVAFYGRRGGWRFCLAVGSIALLLVGVSILLPGQSGARFGFFDWTHLRFQDTEATGLWSIYPAAYRVPAFVCFLILVTGLTIWPLSKTLATLMAHSVAIITATQFWYPQQGTVYVLWYLPLLLLIVFRTPLLFSVPPETGPDVRPESRHAGSGGQFPIGSGVSVSKMFR